jgi:hypothetical protein
MSIKTIDNFKHKLISIILFLLLCDVFLYYIFILSFIILESYDNTYMISVYIFNILLFLLPYSIFIILDLIIIIKIIKNSQISLSNFLKYEIDISLSSGFRMIDIFFTYLYTNSFKNKFNIFAMKISNNIITAESIIIYRISLLIFNLLVFFVIKFFCMITKYIYIYKSKYQYVNTYENINIEIRNMNDNICCICLDQYDNKCKINILDCKHIFHVDCIQKLAIHNSIIKCPICRNESINIL